MFASIKSIEIDSINQLCQLITTHDDWLVSRALYHAQTLAYKREKGTFGESWRVPLQELSQSLVNFLQSHSKAQDDLISLEKSLSPLRQWAIQHIKTHYHYHFRFYRFLEALKTIRQSYLELLALEPFSGLQLSQLSSILYDFFDQLELICCLEWDRLRQTEQLEQTNQYIALSQEQAKSIKELETRLQTIIETDTNGLLVLDTQGMVLLANPAAEALFGRPLSALLGEVLGLPLVEGQATEIEIQNPQNSLIIANLRANSLPWQGKKAYLVSLMDVTENKRTEEKFQMLWRAIEQSPSTIVITDATGTIEYVNPKFEEITGYSAQEAIGQSPRLLKSGKIPPETYQHLWQTITAGEEWHGELCNQKKNGEFFWESASISPIFNYEGEITHFVGIKEDITERKKQEERLTYQANYDALTHLPNRFLVFDRLGQAIEQASRMNKQIAVMFLDLDHFKDVNDTLGHEIGDQLLIQTAERLSSCLRKSDTVARLGGDEFLIILTNLDDYRPAEVIAQKILRILEPSFQLGDEEIFVSVSIGITLYPYDGTETDILLRNADTAMYGAKRDGRNRFKFFTANMNAKAQKRRQIDSHLRYALKYDEIYAVYQPLIDLKTQRIVGAEALMRWNNSKLGQVYPDQFIPIAEETGIITELGAWMLNQACEVASQWYKQKKAIWVAVNLSPRQFRESNFVEIVQAAISQHYLPTHCLELELTERLLIEDIPGARDLIDQLHQMEIRLSLDDFGTGYSSLSYLKKFPFSVLKIDKSFIADLPHDGEAVSLVKTIITMAHSLSLKVIAEGVETQTQAEFLQYHGCDYGQGYYFSRPVLADRFSTLLS